jgi:hypothetical protein
VAIPYSFFLISTFYCIYSIIGISSW